ncbi:PQQ-binding-like beta-propeller repeat protein [Halapricum hydrolyticum]|uniref:PQQ-like beta-propeller repeat protein n=1 Tax=Halapricum hydrolyticum TaxID=2979991 RepID=A0AAE3IBU3_9EURY|nr:PQQ-binding-like beta-propeller repeat protein [Halapricum hydrolyticum]MCU4718736.1 PQQ-like beta-propeller repeat protein [Halapricum hydrolyticum]MCU4727723.1 PQQ-like beta-propeller repeat protein [Halapricum hydrolyticum]
MERRQYLASAAVMLGAGCLSNNSTPENRLSYEAPTDSPPGEFESVTSSRIWEYDPPNKRFITFGAGDGLHIATDAALTCLSPAREIIWTKNTTVDWYSVERPYNLTVAGSTVYYTAMVSGTSFGTNYVGEVGAYDTASGEQRWATTLDTVAQNIISVTEDTVFVGQITDDPAKTPVFALDAETGEERWRTVTGMDMGSAVSHGLCLIYSIVDGLTALDIATGDVAWRRTPGEGYSAGVQVVGDTLCLFLEDMVHYYSLPDGAHLWEQSSAGVYEFAQHSSSSSSEVPNIYIGDDSGNLTALTAATGEKRWVVTTNADGYPEMCVGTDSLFQQSGTTLASYDRVDGDRRWAYSLGSDYDESRLLIADGDLILITRETDQEPVIKAFDVETGHRQWSAQLPTTDQPRVIGVFDEYIVFEKRDRLMGVPVPLSTA